MTFRQAIESTPRLRGAWKPGLGALRATDRHHIKPEDPRHLSGSADIDSTLKFAEPNAHRWDFAIGYQFEKPRKDFIYWVETHTGSDSQIKVVLKKFAWLKDWLTRDGKALAKFEREFLWVSSGYTLFTKGSQQVKILAQKGLIYSGSTLRISSAPVRGGS